MARSVRIIAALAAFALCLIGGMPDDAESQGKPAAPSVDQRFAEEVIELTNAARKKEALPPLRPQDQLAKAAWLHAEDMARRGYFSHTDPMGRQPWDRLEAQGYRYRACAENIAYGAKTPAQVVNLWLKSPGHRKNLLGSFDEIGVGFARSSGKKPRRYWVQVFATPTP